MRLERQREIERILKAYARRSDRGAEGRYTRFEPAHLFQSQTLERALLKLLQREGYTTLAGLRILDAGCGSGAWLHDLGRYGAQSENLIGVDLRVSPNWRTGQSRCVAAAADLLPFPDRSFDLVCELTMLSSVLDRAMRRDIARELQRVLRPSGALLWYDFTVNPLNRDTRGIGSRELSGLFPGAKIRAKRVTLAPPLTRLLAPRSWPVCTALEQIPWLRTHLLAILRPQIE